VKREREKEYNKRNKKSFKKNDDITIFFLFIFFVFPKWRPI